MMTAEFFFDLAGSPHAPLFAGGGPIWDVMKKLKSYLAGAARHNLPRSLPSREPLAQTVVIYQDEALAASSLRIVFGDATKGGLQVFRGDELLAGASVIMGGAVLGEGPIAVGEGALIETGAFVSGPVIVGDRTEIRQGAYIRGNCLVGRRCVVGHVTEAKHSIFLDDAKAGHFAYVGDSILGNRVNLGAGTKLANLKFRQGDIVVRGPAGPLATGLRKLGAILGDDVQTGCNSVTNPGTLLGKKSAVLPNTTVPSGFHAHYPVP